MVPIIRVSYRLVVSVTCLVCLGFSVGMCSESSDALIKTVVSHDDLVYSAKLKVLPCISGSEWESLVIQSKVPVMVMFTADWCGPCRVIDHILDQWQSDFAGRFKFYRVDIETESAIAYRYHVRALPTTIVFKDGIEMARVLGIDSQRLRRLVQKFL